MSRLFWLDDEQWSKIEPLLPTFVPSAKGGRPRVSDEMALNGVLFVLRTGIPWEELPQELGFGSGMTCWRRLRDWQAAGVWHGLHLALLDELRNEGINIEEMENIIFEGGAAACCTLKLDEKPSDALVAKIGKAENIIKVLVK